MSKNGDQHGEPKIKPNLTNYIFVILELPTSILEPNIDDFITF